MVALLSSFLPSDLLQAAGGFFEDASEYDKNLSFQDMNLSRPLLKVVALAPPSPHTLSESKYIITR